MEYRKEIDGLRALAVLPVIFFHAGFEAFSGGFIGVDIFFVISGYLITSILIVELENGKISLVNFYAKRAKRILPALALIMLTCLPFAWFFLSPSDLKEFSKSLIAVSLFSSNIFFWKESGYFETSSELKPLLHTWSLAVEEQYYIIFPLFLIATWHWGKRWTTLILTFIGITSLALAHWGSISDPTATFYLLPTRGWELITGALTALYLTSRKNSAQFKLKYEFLGSLGFFLILYAIFAFDKTTPFPSLYTIIPTTGTVLIILYASNSTLVGRLLGFKIIVGIGLISYSAYLWHQPIFAFSRHLNLNNSNTFLFLALILATLVLAFLSWKFVEQPFRAQIQLTNNQIFFTIAIFILFFIGIGVTGNSTNGFLQYKLNRLQKKFIDTSISSPLRSKCHISEKNYIEPPNACEYYTGSLEVATFGDSHIVEISYALANALKDKKIKLKHFSFSGCVPTFGQNIQGSLKACSNWTENAAKYIVENNDIKTVVISYRINAALFGGHEGLYPLMPNTVSKFNREERWTSYKELIDYFQKNQKKVILILQAPEAPTKVENIIFKSNSNGAFLNGVTREWWNSRNQFVNERIKEISNKTIIIDPTPLFCDSQYCYLTNSEFSYYFDDDHVSIFGANMIVDKIINEMDFK